MVFKLETACLLVLLPTIVYSEFFSDVFSKCDKAEFQCVKDRTCIPKSKLCNDKPDCSDGSDETDCEYWQCKLPYYFRCKDEKCIPSLAVCDGNSDCAGGEDEKNCTTSEHHTNCTKEMFECDTGTCIPFTYVCDGKRDCFDYSDETKGCNLKNRCLSDEFMCKNRKCVPKANQCDQVNDCEDGSDEVECTYRTIDISNCTLNNGKFGCKDRFKCIDIHSICDNKADCYDKSDEDPAICSVSDVIDTCDKNCSHQCVRGPQGTYICICPVGHILRSNGTCEDVNECNEFGICDQMCTNTPGSYRCSCQPMYTLKDDHTCIMKDSEGVLFYSAGDSIKMHFLTSHQNATVVGGLRYTTGISSAGEYLYWTIMKNGYQSIVKGSSVGDFQEAIVTNGLSKPENLAVDWITFNIYFTDADYQRIGVCTNDGYSCTVLHSKDIDKPRAIALSPPNGYMFWSDWGAKPAIARSNMDGSQSKDLVVDQVFWPNGIAVDEPSERIYWVDAKYEQIETITFNGNDRRIVLEQHNIHPFSIALFENKIYWSDLSGHEIISCNKFTGHDRRIIAREPFHHIFGLYAHHHLLTKTNAENPCSSHTCSDMCLLTRTANGELGSTCVCDDSRKMIGSDCVNKRPFSALIAAFGNELFVIEYKNLGRSEIVKFTTDVIGIVDLAHHPSNKSILIFDSFTRRVKSMDFLGHKLNDIGTLTTTRGQSLQYDELGENVYYCNVDALTVEVMSLKTSSKTILINGMPRKAPRYLALVPEKGYMFVAYQMGSLRHRIDRVSMCGSSSAAANFTEVIIYADNVVLHYSRELERLFWADTKLGIIESVTLDGVDRRSIYCNHSIHSFTTIENRLFFTEPKSPIIHSRLVDKYAYSRITIPNVFKKLNTGIVLAATIDSNVSSPCRTNANCSDLCLISHESANGFKCACPLGWAVSTDGFSCVQRRSCKMNEFECYTGECIPKFWLCNGHEDCLHGEDEDVENCATNQCPASQFLCANRKKCVDREKKCDGKNDCEDSSDETYCKFSCDEGEYLCESGECIESQFRCDGKTDCQHGYDETHCDNRTCDANEFMCKSGQCVPAEWECDKESDCSDGSDEGAQCTSGKRLSERQCFDYEFRCSNKNCVHVTLTCNGEDDCGDGSDELNCVLGQINMCNPSFDFFCRTSFRCLPLDAKCNGIVECPGGYDERNCSLNSCDSNKEFYCKLMRKCIPMGWLCDGNNDCGDNSDEISSTCAKLKPIDGKVCPGFQCSNGECILSNRVCDNVYDCSDHSDEGVDCNRSCESFGCSQRCQNSPSGPQCSCRNGYNLHSDNKTCVDVNECDLNICSQGCKNTNGSFVCHCYSPWYQLKNNHVTCKAKGKSLLLVTASESSLDIFSTNMKHKEEFNLGTNLMRQIRGVEADGAKNQIYVLLDNDELLRANISQKRPFHWLRLWQATDFTYDWISDNVYYVRNHVLIVITDFESSKNATVYRTVNENYIWTLSVDPVAGYLFWYESGSKYNQTSGSIMRADCNGANVKPLLSKLPYGVRQLIIDSWDRNIYWLHVFDRNIYRMDYDGLNANSIFHSETGIETFTFFENTIYWVTRDSTEFPVRKCNIYGIPPLKCSTMTAKLAYVNYLTILQKNHQRSVEQNPCSLMSCPSFCLMLPHGPTCAVASENSLGLCTTSSCSEKESKGRSGHYFAYLVISCLIVMVVLVLYNRYKNAKSPILHGFHFHNPTYDTPEKNNSIESKEIETPSLQPGEHIYENPLCEEQKSSLKNKLSIQKGENSLLDALYEVDVEYDANTRRPSNESLIKKE